MALDDFLKAHPETQARSTNLLTEEEENEVEHRVDAMIAAIIEPYHEAFGLENIQVDQAWFIDRALQMHEGTHAVPIAQLTTTKSSVTTWAERVATPVKAANRSRPAPLRAAKLLLPANDTDHIVAANGTIGHVFKVIRESEGGITDFDTQHYLKAKSVFEAKARAMNAEPESGVAYRF